MGSVKTYKLKPTALIPNSPWPLIHYQQAFPEMTNRNPADLHQRMRNNGWETQWIFRYGQTQASHYHSKAHECMIVLTGSATIRFGVADVDSPNDNGSEQDSHEDGGIEVHAEAGDVFILPAGTAHKTFNPGPDSTFKLLTPGDGHHLEGDDEKEVLRNIPLSGFTMLGAYPKGSEWNFAVGGEDKNNYETVWSVPKPELDPVRGSDAEGLCSLWE